MSIDLSSEQPAADKPATVDPPLAGSLDYLRQRGDDWRQFLDERIGDLHRLYEEVDQQHRDLVRTQNELAADREAFSEQQAAQALAAHESAVAIESETALWNQRALAAEQQNRALSTELDQLRSAMATTVETDQQSQRQALDALSSQVAQLEQERQELELELEHVRNRAAETVEKTAQQQRQMKQERTKLASELKQLRRQLDAQAKLLSQPNSNSSTQLPGLQPMLDVGRGSTQTTAASGKIVDSIVAQFEQLQRDRRARSAKGRPAPPRGGKP